MGIPHYLAMTGAEMAAGEPLPEKLAWMACHFSPYRTCASNLPHTLPPGSLMILDDVTPICGHDPEAVCAQLAQRAEDLDCCGIVLDFQRPGYTQTAVLAGYLTQHLSLPAAVSELYARELDCAVFLPPVPLHTLPEDWLSPWQGREIWLETALEAEVLTLTREGAAFSPLPLAQVPAEGFPEPRLCCRYRIEADQDAARFTLWRSREDQAALLEKAAALGVSQAIGLYQEWKTWEA